MRHGSGLGSVALATAGAGDPARARTVEGHEVLLPTYQHFAADDLLSQ